MRYAKNISIRAGLLASVGTEELEEKEPREDSESNKLELYGGQKPGQWDLEPKEGGPDEPMVRTPRQEPESPVDLVPGLGSGCCSSTTPASTWKNGRSWFPPWA